MAVTASSMAVTRADGHATHTQTSYVKLEGVDSSGYVRYGSLDSQLYWSLIPLPPSTCVVNPEVCSRDILDSHLLLSV